MSIVEVNEIAIKLWPFTIVVKGRDGVRTFHKIAGPLVRGYTLFIVGLVSGLTIMLAAERVTGLMQMVKFARWLGLG